MDKNKIAGRLKAIKGQLELVINMIENKNDYFPVMQQSKAVYGGLRKLNNHILRYHLNSCTFRGNSKMEQREDFKRIMQVVKKY